MLDQPFWKSFMILNKIKKYLNVIEKLARWWWGIMRLYLSENRKLGRWRIKLPFLANLIFCVFVSCGWKEEIKGKGLIRVRSLIDFSIMTPKRIYPWGKGQVKTNPPDSLIFTWGFQEKRTVLTEPNGKKSLRGWDHQLILSWICKSNFPFIVGKVQKP